MIQCRATESFPRGVLCKLYEIQGQLTPLAKLRICEYKACLVGLFSDLESAQGLQTSFGGFLAGNF